MIKLLHIENIAVIDKADIEFTEGLNVLTGETGAGKSIIIDALSAVAGGRTSREIIRTGASFAYVSAVFSGQAEGPSQTYKKRRDGEGWDEHSSNGPETDNMPQDTDLAYNVISWFNDNSVEPDESGDVYISRKISADGKSVCRVNGAPVTAAQLRELGAALLDIHGQNDGRKLLDDSAHLSYLDIFGGLGAELETYRGAYKKLCEKRGEIEKLSVGENEKSRRIEVLKHSITELERAKLRPGEHDEISSRRELLINASKLTENVDAAFEAMYGGENTAGAAALIIDAGAMLERAARYSDELRPICRQLNDLRYNAQDISDALRDFRARLDFTPCELDELELRLDTLKRIIRKYGGEEEALSYLEKAVFELSDIESSAGRLVKLEIEFGNRMQEARSAAEKLSETRKAAAAMLEREVCGELEQLNMPGARFNIEFGESKGEYGLSGHGKDEAVFLISANAGEEPGRISKIASGGELARIMLAMKNVISGGVDSGAMVFDEIDAGVSGIAAQRVGEKLAKLARHRQVLCVTHLPQIAVMADAHFEIRKNISGGRTYTHVTNLDFEGRKKEIARLSGGENVTQTTLDSAEEQLTAAGTYKKQIN